MIKIADFQDKRLSDSLYTYFENENSTIRHDAVLSFASIQDTLSADKIGKLLLGDNNANVRRAAAFALGQTNCIAATEILLQSIAIERDNSVLKIALEAYGKIAPTKKLYVNSGLKQSDDVNAGYAWMNYRFGLRSILDSLMVEENAKLLDCSNSEYTRLGAASFFARSGKNFENVEQRLEKTSQGDSSAEIRMNTAFALRKIKSDSSLLVLLNRAQYDTDYRVRVNVTRALHVFPFAKTKATLFHALSDKNINVAIAASGVIKATAAKEFWNEILTKAREVKNWRTQADLYEASLIATDVKDVVEEIFGIYKNSTNPYQKAALLISLQHSVMAYDFLNGQLNESNVPVIKLSAATALVSINGMKDFPSSLTKTFTKIYIAGINAGDPGVVSTFAAALADSTLGYKNVIKDFSFLYAAKQKFTLPKHVETIQPLHDAIAYFEGRKRTTIRNEFNHPIDWQLVKKIPRDQQAIIKTMKGDIVIQLFVEEAPGSVSNFVALAKAHYFDHKIFHRVVPNFVVQGGCNRGDGFGSEDYSIRSEFNLRRYKTGSIGMASAGKDTESTQWFITHSPTPHLDGRYTIFAEVKEGMDVVHHLEVGDEIVSVVLK
jgi:cyclophilin family peptidyl-prolyl cis-trans isomerase/HEAT repeat protein